MDTGENPTPDKAEYGTKETVFEVEEKQPGILKAEISGVVPVDSPAKTDSPGKPMASQKKKTPEEKFEEWFTAGGRFDGSSDRGYFEPVCSLRADL